MLDLSEVRPLQGVRALSLAVNIPGPVAAARLRDLGASLTKVEPSGGDPLAVASRAWYDALTRGQEVFTLNLKEARDRNRLDALLVDRDLLLTSMRPPALERLGLSASALGARHPRLCTVAITGYPAPHRDRAGHDLTYQAAAGLVRPPALPATVAADLAAAERAVSTALALLLGRERTGAGAYVEVPIATAAAELAAPLRHGLTRRGGPLGGGLPVYALYPAAEGWVALAALEPHFVARLTAELGLSGPRRDELAAVFRSRSAGEWEAWAHERDLPLAAVRDEGLPHEAAPQAGEPGA